jgi:hypothetical protein
MPEAPMNEHDRERLHRNAHQASGDAINSHPKIDDYQIRISRQIDGTPFHACAHSARFLQLHDSHHAGRRTVALPTLNHTGAISEVLTGLMAGQRRSSQCQLLITGLRLN